MNTPGLFCWQPRPGRKGVITTNKEIRGGTISLDGTSHPIEIIDNGECDYQALNHEAIEIVYLDKLDQKKVSSQT